MFLIKSSVRRTPLNPAALSFRSTQMLKLGQIGIQSIKDRVAHGLGSQDSPMPPLRQGYARQKQRFGQPATRNLRGPGIGGHMLDNISVRAVTDGSFTIDLTSSRARVKALANEQLAPWWQFSPNDLAVLGAAADEMFRSNVADSIRAA